MFKLLLLQDSYAYLPSADYLAIIDRLMQGQRVTHLLLASTNPSTSALEVALDCSYMPSCLAKQHMQAGKLSSCPAKKRDFVLCRSRGLLRVC